MAAPVRWRFRGCPRDVPPGARRGPDSGVPGGEVLACTASAASTWTSWADEASARWTEGVAIALDDRRPDIEATMLQNLGDALHYAGRGRRHPRLSRRVGCSHELPDLQGCSAQRPRVPGSMKIVVSPVRLRPSPHSACPRPSQADRSLVVHSARHTSSLARVWCSRVAPASVRRTRAAAFGGRESNRTSVGGGGSEHLDRGATAP